MRAMMMMVALLSVVLTGCSLKVNDKEVAKVGDGNTSQSEDSYDFTYNGCKTNRHSFSGSPEDVRSRLCAALQDEALNNGCAQSMREQMFNSKCTGSFKPKYRTTDTVADQAEKMLLNVDGLTETERAEGAKALAELL